MKVKIPVDPIEELQNAWESQSDASKTDSIDELFWTAWSWEQNSATAIPSTDTAETPIVEESITPIVEPAKETTPPEPVIVAEKEPSKTEWEDPELDALMKDMESIATSVQENTTETEQAVQNSALPEQEKQDLLAKLKEKEDLVSELLIKNKAVEDRLYEKIAESENYKIDGASNKRFLDKFENDPDVQEYVSLRIRMDGWDEKAKSRLENFYKDQLSLLGYDMEALATEKRRREKEALSKEVSWPRGGNFDKSSAKQDDVIDSLDI